MSFIPDEELKERNGIALAPMIDFLFLMLAVFASLAISRIVMQDTEIELVFSKTDSTHLVSDSRDYKLIHVTISKDGSYKWVTEIRDYPMESAQAIAQELLQQYQLGFLPEEKIKTQVLLKIDREAQWEPILHALLAIREAGFEARPVYEPVEKKVL